MQFPQQQFQQPMMPILPFKQEDNLNQINNINIMQPPNPYILPQNLAKSAEQNLIIHPLVNPPNQQAQIQNLESNQEHINQLNLQQEININNNSNKQSHKLENIDTNSPIQQDQNGSNNIETNQKLIVKNQNILGDNNSESDEQNQDIKQNSSNIKNQLEIKNEAQFLNNVKDEQDKKEVTNNIQTQKQNSNKDKPKKNKQNKSIGQQNLPMNQQFMPFIPPQMHPQMHPNMMNPQKSKESQNPYNMPNMPPPYGMYPPPMFMQPPPNMYQLNQNLDQSDSESENQQKEENNEKDNGNKQKNQKIKKNKKQKQSEIANMQQQMMFMPPNPYMMPPSPYFMPFPPNMPQNPQQMKAEDNKNFHAQNQMGVPGMSHHPNFPPMPMMFPSPYMMPPFQQDPNMRIVQMKENKNQNKKKYVSKNPDGKETKNIPKNYARGIYKYTVEHLAKVQEITGLEKEQIMPLLDNLRDRIHSIKHLRDYWVMAPDNDDKKKINKAVRILSRRFLNDEAYPYFYHSSRMKNPNIALKFRRYLINILSDPQNFYYLKPKDRISQYDDIIQTSENNETGVKNEIIEE